MDGFYSKEILGKKWNSKQAIATTLATMQKSDAEMGYYVDLGKNEVCVGKWYGDRYYQYMYRILMTKDCYFHLKLLSIAK